MTDHLEVATRLTRLQPGVFGASLDRSWWIINGPNGGFIGALMLRAMSETLKDAIGDEDRAPRSLTVHYTSPPTEGPAQIETTLERSGRSLSTLTARLIQDGKLRAIAIGALSLPRGGPEFNDLRMPEVPCADDLDPMDPGAEPIPMRARYEMRPIPGTGRGARTGQAISASWIRLAGPGRDLDGPLLTAYADALAPAVFALGGEHDTFGPVPTVDLTVHFRNHDLWQTVGPKASVLAFFRTHLSESGFLEEDGEIWSADGHLLAHARQLAVVL